MLKISFLGVQFENPIVLASGILGVTAASMNRAVNNGCGGVTIKSLSKEERTGHPNPTMIGQEHFFLNAVGLSNPGVEQGIEEIKKFKQMTNTPLIGSIFAGTVDEMVETAEKICEAPIDFLEINISCPNVGDEFGTPFAYSAEGVEKISSRIAERVKVPIIMKLSPNAWNNPDIAKAAEAGGASAVNAVNTVSGMSIDVRSRAPILHNKVGGVSGPALYPIALKNVYDIYRAVSIPIVGTGGITNGEDALAMIMAGATLIGVGSAVYYRGEDVFKKINEEMAQIMREENIKSLEEIRGVANEKKSKSVSMCCVSQKDTKLKKNEGNKLMDKPKYLPIVKIVDENPCVKTFYFDYELKSKPGQFVMLWIPGLDQKPFSVGYDDGKRFGLTIFKRGPLTERLFEMKAGGRVGISGSYGTSFSVLPNKHYIMVAGGYGAAPLGFLAEELAKQDNVDIDFCIGARSSDFLLFENRLNNIKMHITTDDGSKGYQGYVSDILVDVLHASCNKDKIVVVCGPELMEKKVLDICNQYNVDCEVSIERYMKCGVGVCGQCSVDDLGICMCMQGPVVKRELANRIKEFGKYHHNKSGGKERF